MILIVYFRQQNFRLKVKTDFKYNKNTQDTELL